MSKGKPLFCKTLHDFRQEGSAASERQHNPKDISLEGVIATELGPELRSVALKPLPSHSRSGDRAVRIRRSKFALPAARDHVAKLSDRIVDHRIMRLRW